MAEGEEQFSLLVPTESTMHFRMESGDQVLPEQLLPERHNAIDW